MKTTTKKLKPKSKLKRVLEVAPEAPTKSGKAGKSDDSATRLRSRIVGHADVSPKLLKAHVMNFRKHPESQMNALRGSMDELGWLKEVLVSKRTMTIIDGHARWEEAVKRKMTHIPVTYLDLDENEERKALSLLDPITEMAQRDVGMFQKILESCESKNEIFNEMVKKMQPLKDEPLAELQTSTKIMEYNADVFFPSSNKWQIPDLRKDMLYDGDCPTTTWPADNDEGHPQFYIWGSGGIDERVTGKVLCFYTDDYRFETLWNDAVETIKTVVPLMPRAAVTPDFSLFADTPLVVQLWQIYRARWVSRFWQEAGIKIIPSLATSSRPECYEFAYDGLPKRPSLMAMQARSGGVKSKQQLESYVKDISELIERVHPERLVIYGSSNRLRLESSLPGGTKYIWSQSFTEARTLQGAFKKKKKAT